MFLFLGLERNIRYATIVWKRYYKFLVKHKGILVGEQRPPHHLILFDFIINTICLHNLCITVAITCNVYGESISSGMHFPIEEQYYCRIGVRNTVTPNCEHINKFN